jgi:autotransporter-associated beta strand protein
LIGLLAVVGFVRLEAAQLTYSGTTDGVWGNASNWSPSAPGSGSTLLDTRLNINSLSSPLVYDSGLGTTVLDISAGGGENRAIVMGALSDSANGQLNVTGGTLELRSEGSTATLLIGAGAGAGYTGSATVHVSGGNLTLPGASSAIGILSRGAAGATGSLTLSGTGSVLSDLITFGELAAIPSSSATARLNLNGGTLQTRAIFDRSAVANSEIHFNGGTLRSNDTGNGSHGAWIRSTNGGIAVTLQAGGGTLDTNGQDNQQIAVGIAGSAGGALTKIGGGRLVLQAASTYDGATQINAGALRISHATALGATSGVTTVANNARLELSGGITVTGESVTINGHGGTFSINGSSAGSASGALQSATGNNVWNGPVVLGTDLPRVGAQRTATLNIQGGIGDGASSNLIVRNEDNSNPVTDSSRGITIVSAPAGGNTYTGFTDVYRGYLRLGAHDTLPTGTTVRLGTSGGAAFFGLLDLNGFNQTISGLTTGPGGTAANQYVTNNGALLSTLTVNNTADMTYGGTIKNGSGTLALAKGGSGTLTLTGKSFFTGVATIHSGTLRLSGAGALEFSGEGPSAIVINSGGVLRDESAGIGTILDTTSVTINTGGVFSSNQNEYIGPLHGNGSWIFDHGSSSLDMAVVTGGTSSGTFSGSITQTGLLSQHFSKRGAGTQTLSGVNSYRGETRLIEGVLRVTSGNEATLGTPNPSASAVHFTGGTLRVSTASLTLDDAGRGIFLGAGGGVMEVDSGLNLTLATPMSGVNVNLTKTGAGTLRLQGNEANLGTLNVVAGVAELAGGATLRVNTLNQSGGVFVWGQGRLTHSAITAQEGVTQYSSVGYQDVYSGKSLVVNGDLTSDAGSILSLSRSPTFYLNNGVRFNNVTVSGSLDLSAADDVLEVEINPYILRPFAPSLGTGAIEYGSLPFVVVDGTLTGTFDTFLGVGNDGRGFALSAFSVSSGNDLDPNTYYLEHDTLNGVVWFHYKVTGYVPEPDTFALGMLGLIFLRLRRRMASARAEMVPSPQN